MSQLKFCGFNQQQFDGICDLFCRSFETSKPELTRFYESLQKGFNLKDWPSPVFAERNFFSSQSESFQTKYNNAEIIACDLPSLLSRGGRNTVMIIAQDSYNSTPATGMWIGTPYGLHVRKMREEKHTRHYMQMIDALLCKGYQTYLTDFYKVYVGGLRLPKQDKQVFADILKQEIEVINPVALITWGKDASNAVARLKPIPPQYSYPHPSGNARSAWKKRMGQKATNENILNYWQHSILQQLDS